MGLDGLAGLSTGPTVGAFRTDRQTDRDPDRGPTEKAGGRGWDGTSGPLQDTGSNLLIVPRRRPKEEGPHEVPFQGQMVSKGLFYVALPMGGYYPHFPDEGTRAQSHQVVRQSRPAK